MKRDDLSRSLVAFDQNSTLVSVVELGLKSWLVGGLVPGVNRQPLKKLKPDPDSLLALLARWRNEAIKASHTISRIVVAFEAGYDGFWLARWLRARVIEAYVIHPTSIPVSREQQRAKTDRLDTALPMRPFLAGSVVSQSAAIWWQSRPLPRKTRAAPLESARHWCGTKPVLSPAAGPIFFWVDDVKQLYVLLTLIRNQTRMSGHKPDLRKATIAQLAQLYPECFYVARFERRRLKIGIRRDLTIWRRSI